MYNSFSCAHQYYKISIYEQKTLTNLHYMDQETDNKYKQTEIYNPFLHKRIKSHKSTTLQCIVNVQVWNLYTVYVLSNKNWNSSNPFLHANPSSKQQKRYTQHNHFQNPQSLLAVLYWIQLAVSEPKVQHCLSMIKDTSQIYKIALLKAIPSFVPNSEPTFPFRMVPN